MELAYHTEYQGIVCAIHVSDASYIYQHPTFDFKSDHTVKKDMFAPFMVPTLQDKHPCIYFYASYGAECLLPFITDEHPNRLLRHRRDQPDHNWCRNYIQ